MCLKRHNQNHEDKQAAAKLLYGKVGAEEYTAAIKAADAMPGVPEETLREDYGLDTDYAGVFSVGYTCYCASCGFGFSYNHEVNALEMEATPDVPRLQYTEGNGG